MKQMALGKSPAFPYTCSWVSPKLQSNKNPSHFFVDMKKTIS